MEYMKVTQAAEQWGVSDRRVRILCQQGKIEGVIQKGRSYLIPCNAVKPIDGRTLRHKTVSEQYLPMLSRIDSIKEQLDQRRPLTTGELQRLQEEFLVEYTYNSNAIEGNTLTLQETALVLEGITIDRKPLKDHLEAVGHKDAFLYVQDLVKEKAPFWGALRKEGAPGRLLYLSLISSWKRCNHCGYAVFSLLRSARCCWKASSISSGINSWSMPTPL